MIQALKATTLTNASPPASLQVYILHLEITMEKLPLDDKQPLREFAVTVGKSASQQHRTGQKHRLDTAGHLPYQISFCTQPREPGSTVTTASLLGEPNPAENDGPRNQCNKLIFSTKYCSPRRRCLLWNMLDAEKNLAFFWQYCYKTYSWIAEQE